MLPRLRLSDARSEHHGNHDSLFFHLRVSVRHPVTGLVPKREQSGMAINESFATCSRAKLPNANAILGFEVKVSVLRNSKSLVPRVKITDDAVRAVLAGAMRVSDQAIE